MTEDAGSQSSLNPAAIDILVVQHPDGSARSSPWHVCFGSLCRNKLNRIVAVVVNGCTTPVVMYINRNHCCQFEEDFDEQPNFNASPSPEIITGILPFLNAGSNTVVFQPMAESTKLTANLFLFEADKKVAISDIDGTITSSDTLGVIMPFLGMSWIHPGITKLYNEAASRGVNYIYLTARPKSLADSTRKMLGNVVQNGEHLPPGPIFTCPERLWAAVSRELKGDTHRYKIPTLQMLQSLYEPFNPFVMAFGNRESDAKAYAEVGILDSRVVLFDKKHRVKSPSGEQLFGSIIEFANCFDNSPLAVM